ncbi:extensin-2-like [Folsomia candida]|uniref:extensin-2-like n=1 Tax=Folsomia candida TaxID=158441 RepID=UPI001604F7B1|nr:extensin-2-like [Folsomia candida]
MSKWTWSYLRPTSPPPPHLVLPPPPPHYTLPPRNLAHVGIEIPLVEVPVELNTPSSSSSSSSSVADFRTPTNTRPSSPPALQTVQVDIHPPPSSLAEETTPPLLLPPGDPEPPRADPPDDLSIHGSPPGGFYIHIY